MTEKGIIGDHPDKKIFWEAHVRERQELKLTRSQYCRERGLSLSAMGYWDVKLLGRSSVPAKVGCDSRFSPVMLTARCGGREGMERIDPVWLARLIRALL